MPQERDPKKVMAEAVDQAATALSTIDMLMRATVTGDTDDERLASYLERFARMIAHVIGMGLLLDSSRRTEPEMLRIMLDWLGHYFQEGAPELAAEIISMNAVAAAAARSKMPPED